MTATKSNRKRIIYLDVIRSLACLMVITMHSPQPGTNGLLQNVIYLATSPCIGLFFMVSGALLLPVEGNGWEWVRRRLGKILCPTVFWTLFYVLANTLTSRCEWSDVPNALMSMPFSAQGHGILWFMYTLCGLYLLAPVISPWLRLASRREVECLLLLWVATLFFPILRMFVSVNEGNTGMFYYFTGYGGYFLLGYYLRRYGLQISRFVWPLLILTPFVVAIACKQLRCEIDFYDLFWYLSVLCAMMALF